MSENNINFDDYLGHNCHSSSESCCSGENNFYIKVDDTLNDDISKSNKKLACQLTTINNEFNTLKLLIILLIIYIMYYSKNC